MIALTICTFAPLHRSFLQHSISHLMIFPEGTIFLQFFSLQSDEVAHPLTKASVVTPEISAFCIHFSTTVLTVQTGYLFCTFFFAVIPALNRSKQRHIRSISGHNLENGNKYKNIINSLNLEGLPTQLSHSNNSIFLFFGA